MEILASLFVTMVTVASAVFPQVGADKILEADQAKALSGSVLSQTTENTNPNLANPKVAVRAQDTTNVATTTETQSEFLIQLRDRVNTTATVDQATKRERESSVFRKSLSEISNEKKRKTVENLSERLQTLNEKWVAQWNKVLVRLGEVLTKLEKVTDQAKNEGKDVTLVTEAVTVAQNKILEAQAAVAAQAQKTYPITIVDEENLGQNVRTAINLFHNDIKNTQAVVKEAKESVVAVYQALAKVRGEKNNDQN